jgi:hypothetical protein
VEVEVTETLLDGINDVESEADSDTLTERDADTGLTDIDEVNEVLGVLDPVVLMVGVTDDVMEIVLVAEVDKLTLPVIDDVTLIVPLDDGDWLVDTLPLPLGAAVMDTLFDSDAELVADPSEADTDPVGESVEVLEEDSDVLLVSDIVGDTVALKLELDVMEDESETVGDAVADNDEEGDTDMLLVTEAETDLEADSDRDTELDSDTVHDSDTLADSLREDEDD